MASLRFGILGAANFAAEHMGPAIHQATGAQLFALATSKPQKAERFTAFCPDLRVHDSYAALLADADIDAVYVPLPNHLHVEWALKAMDAGKHVLVEKPIALQAAEIDALIAKRNATGLLAAEAYMIVHHPQWQRARQLLAEGAIGTLEHVEGFFCYNNRDPKNIRNQAAFGGGGIRDIGVYTYGSARFVTGEEPTQINLSKIKWENGVDTFAEVSADFPSFTYHAVTAIRMSPRQEMVFHGDKGVMRLRTPFNANVFDIAEVELSYPDLTRRIERFPGVNHYKLQVENFAQTVRSGANYPWSLENAQGTQAMIDMVFAAAS